MPTLRSYRETEIRSWSVKATAALAAASAPAALSNDTLETCLKLFG
jgi:hypothetical protein